MEQCQLTTLYSKLMEQYVSVDNAVFEVDGAVSVDEVDEVDGAVFDDIFAPRMRVQI